MLAKEKYQRGAAEFESGWIKARTEMEDVQAVAVGQAKAEADRRVHEVRASSEQSIAKLTVRLDEANASSAQLRGSMP